MKQIALQYTIDARNWTDLRQNGHLEINEQAYLLNAIRTPEKFFKDIYLAQYLQEKIIKDALPKEKKQILAKKIPFSCQQFNAQKIKAPKEGNFLLKLQVPESQLVTVDFKIWLYIANSVNKALKKYNSLRQMNQILALPEKELKLDQESRVYLLDVLGGDKTMNLLPGLKLAQVAQVYENANGHLQEVQNY